MKLTFTEITYIFIKKKFQLEIWLNLNLELGIYIILLFSFLKITTFLI